MEIEMKKVHGRHITMCDGLPMQVFAATHDSETTPGRMRVMLAGVITDEGGDRVVMPLPPHFRLEAN